MHAVHKMWPTATDGVVRSMCLMVMFVSPVKTAELIEILTNQTCYLTSTPTEVGVL